MGRIRNLQLTHSRYYAPDQMRRREGRRREGFEKTRWQAGRSMTEQLREEREYIEATTNFIERLWDFVRKNGGNEYKSAKQLGVSRMYLHHVLNTGTISQQMRKKIEVKLQELGGENDNQTSV